MVQLQVNQFRFNKDETVPALRFPDLALRAYSFNIQVSGVSYIVRISYNVWTNNGQVSIYDSTQLGLRLNAPLIQNVGTGFPNYLQNIPVFSGYSLIWDMYNQRFVFSSL